ncbi:hypothetical protein C6P40_003466 [Pichia californica]|uniref:CCZ1/INTU/HSP4 first Longin domain-containing protein n=1 Tax=Pichia californica TaxID=460514 RepID=A0A9P6WGK8_9ASCO|nr:hypothetical protein C6P40_003466 [[Candida] californica]
MSDDSNLMDQNNNNDGKTDDDNDNIQWSLPWSSSKATNEANNNNSNNTFSKITSDHEIIKQIGLLQAITDLSGKFNSGSKNTKISYIDTNQTRTIIGSFELQDIENDDNSLTFWFSCKFQFAKVILTNGDIKYLQRGLASPEYLKNQILKGYELWCLNNGSLKDYINKLNKFESRIKISNWWHNWFINKFEFPSSYDSTDDAIFKLIPGIRYSCVNKPIGFKENINEKLKSFINQQSNLNDILILNTNWTPEKNWGIIYLNNDSIYSIKSLDSLIFYLKDLDLRFGLSTYALTYGNWPSLKQYVNSLKRLKSIKPNGGLFERSLMEPAIYLQEKLTNNVFNPFTNVINSMESYIPLFNNIIDVSNIVPTTVSSINTVKNVTLHPLDSIYSYWNSSTINEPDDLNNQLGESIQEEENIDVEEESRSTSKRTIQSSNIDESLETAQKSGSYLLGCSKQGSIILHDFHLFNKISQCWNIVKLIIYEINGILFVLFYESENNENLNSPIMYSELSKNLNSIYETYFTDLILNQLKSLQDDMIIKSKNNEKLNDFEFIIYDDNKYWTNISNIPPDHDTLMHQIPERIQIVEQNMNSTDLDFLRTLSLMQDKQLQSIIINNITPSNSWISNEKIFRLGKNIWCLFHRYNDNKWVIVIKSLANINGNENFIFGEDVKKWLNWVENNGYL